MTEVKTFKMRCHQGCEHICVAQPGERFFTEVAGNKCVVAYVDTDSVPPILRLDLLGADEEVPHPGGHRGYSVETSW